MPRFQHLTKRSSKVKQQSAKQRKPVSALSAMMPRLFGVAVVTSVAVYLVLANGIATKGYQIEQLAQERSQLRQAVAQLETSVLEQQSLETVTQKTEQLELVSIQAITYISAGDTAVALNE